MVNNDARRLAAVEVANALAGDARLGQVRRMNLLSEIQRSIGLNFEIDAADIAKIEALALPSDDAAAAQKVAWAIGDAVGLHVRSDRVAGVLALLRARPG